jgi:hypothetical protein
MKEPKIGKWKLNNYAKAIGMVGGLVLAGFGLGWYNEYSNWYALVIVAGLAMFGCSLWWAATDKSTRDDNPKTGSAK